MTVLEHRDGLQAEGALSQARSGLTAFLRRLRKTLAQWGKRPSPPPQALVSLVEIILVALIAVACARLFWTIWAIFVVAPTHDLQSTPAAAAPTAALADANPFGRAEAAATVAATAVADTALDLRLFGTWVDAGGKGSAVIQIPGGAQKTFAIGDEVCCGATLAEVYADRVVIARGGAREALRLPHKQDASSAPPEPIPAPPEQSALQQIFSVQPVSTADGGFRLQLFPAGDPARFSKLGLQPGDILLSINGVAASSDAGAVAALLASAQQSGAITIVVDRAGAPMTINLDELAGAVDLN